MSGLPTLVPPPSSRLAAVRQWLLVPANLLLVLLLVLVAFPLFFDLGYQPVQLWDESRLAMNALEMSHGGNWLVTTFEGQPDHWNTKPPLLIWLQALCLKVFGYGTWSLRLPTSLAALGTIVLLYRFAAYTLRRPLAGFFGGLVLATTMGYVRGHGARTGDYDAMLAFWEVVVWISFFQYLENGRRRTLYWLGAALTAAVLTKGVAGLLGVPALLVYAGLRGKLLWLLRQPRLYAVAVVGAAVLAGYYLGREALDHGYLAAVRDNELGGRFGQSTEGHEAPWSYYFDLLYSHDFSTWVWWLVPAVLVWLQPNQLVRRAGLLLLLFALGWLLIISTSATKLEWYGIPAYPPLALLTGLGLDFFYYDLLAVNLPRLPRLLAWPLRVAIVLGLFYLPFRSIMHQIGEARITEFSGDHDTQLGHYVGQLVAAQPTLDTLTLVSSGGYNAALLYYKTTLKYAKNKEIAVRYHRDVLQLRPGSIALVCDPAYRTQLDSAYQLITVHQEGPCETVLLASHK